MASVTFAVDKQLKESMEHFSWVNWSAVAKDGALKKAKLLLLLKKPESADEIAFLEWAAETVRSNRKDRLQELKKLGLI